MFHLKEGNDGIYNTILNSRETAPKAELMIGEFILKQDFSLN